LDAKGLRGLLERLEKLMDRLEAENQAEGEAVFLIVSNGPL